MGHIRSELRAQQAMLVQITQQLRSMAGRSAHSQRASIPQLIVRDAVTRGAENDTEGSSDPPRERVSTVNAWTKMRRASINGLSALQGRRRTDPKITTFGKGRGSVAQPECNTMASTWRRSVHMRGEPDDRKSEPARTSTHEGPSTVDRRATFLNADHVGEVLRNNHELNDLLDGIQREQRAEIAAAQQKRRVVFQQAARPSSPFRRHMSSRAPTIEAQIAVAVRTSAVPVLHPDHVFRRYWDFAMIFAVVYSCLSVPLTMVRNPANGPAGLR